MRKLVMGFLLGVIGMLLAACGGVGGNAGPDIGATNAALDAMPQLEVTVSGGLDTSISARSTGLGCTGANGIVRNAFVITQDNLTIYIPVTLSPGQIPVVGRNEPGAVDASNVVFEYLPTSSQFFGGGSEGTFTLNSLPSRVGEFAMGDFDITLTDSDDTEINLVGRFRVPASLRTFDACPGQLVATPIPPPE